MPRVYNDVSERPTLYGLHKLVGFYKEARALRLSRKLSVRFAMKCYEAEQWHSRTLDPLSLRWRGEGRIDTSIERFLRILSRVTGVTVSLKMLDWCDNADVFLLAVADSKARCIVRSQVARRNYETVVGVPRSDGPLLWLMKVAKARNEWYPIRRGRDLFILWPFDLARALGQYEGLDAMILPSNLRCFGYHSRYLPETKEQIAYVRRWSAWWKQNMARMDELVLKVPVPLPNLPWNMETPSGFDQSMHPERLLRQLGELRQQRIDRMNRPMGDPPKMVYPWVSELLEPVETPKGKLIPVTTRQQLIDCGHELHNCAGGYGYQLESKNCLLAYLEDQQGRKIALAQYEPDGDLIQCVTQCNQRAPEEIRTVFEGVRVSWNPNEKGP